MQRGSLAFVHLMLNVANVQINGTGHVILYGLLGSIGRAVVQNNDLFGNTAGKGYFLYFIEDEVDGWALVISRDDDREFVDLHIRICSHKLRKIQDIVP